MSLEKITARLFSDSERECAEIVGKAEKDADRVIKNAHDEAARLIEAEAESASADAEKLIETSGLLMVAKNNETHEFLAQQIKDKTAVKKYLAIVKGSIKDESGIINLPIGRHPKQPHKMAVVEDGKPSITEYKVLERFKNATYLELNLKTGRTHQIRVHLSYFRTPIFNDTLYGAKTEKIKTQEQVLQAYKLEFTKPNSNEIIKLEIEPDEKIQKVLTYLRSQK